MPDVHGHASIGSVTATVAHLFGTAPPLLSAEAPLPEVVLRQSELLNASTVDRCLVFCPDALGAHIWPKCGVNHADTIEKYAPQRVSLSSVMPPKTPVCFASMFTGGPPAAHGIRHYERPVLKCDTLFDALLRANRSIAIVAVANSSIDLIFRGRAMDYFSEADDRAAERRAVSVIRESRHNLVLVYQQEYDDLLHATNPFSDQCIDAVSHHLHSFVVLAEEAAMAWAASNYAIVFAPDHGAHVCSSTGHGDHGEDIPEDVDLFHWYGIWPASQ